MCCAESVEVLKTVPNCTVENGVLYVTDKGTSLSIVHCKVAGVGYQSEEEGCQLEKRKKIT